MKFCSKGGRNASSVIATGTTTIRDTSDEMLVDWVSVPKRQKKKKKSRSGGGNRRNDDDDDEQTGQDSAAIEAALETTRRMQEAAAAALGSENSVVSDGAISDKEESKPTRKKEKKKVKKKKKVVDDNERVEEVEFVPIKIETHKKKQKKGLLDDVDDEVRRDLEEDNSSVEMAVAGAQRMQEALTVSLSPQQVVETSVPQKMKKSKKKKDFGDEVLESKSEKKDRKSTSRSEDDDVVYYDDDDDDFEPVQDEGVVVSITDTQRKQETVTSSLANPKEEDNGTKRRKDKKKNKKKKPIKEAIYEEDDSEHSFQVVIPTVTSLDSFGSETSRKRKNAKAKDLRQAEDEAATIEATIENSRRRREAVAANLQQSKEDAAINDTIAESQRKRQAVAASLSNDVMYNDDFSSEIIRSDGESIDDWAVCRKSKNTGGGEEEYIPSLDVEPAEIQQESATNGNWTWPEQEQEDYYRDDGQSFDTDFYDGGAVDHGARFGDPPGGGEPDHDDDLYAQTDNDAEYYDEEEDYNEHDYAPDYYASPGYQENGLIDNEEYFNDTYTGAENYDNAENLQGRSHDEFYNNESMEDAAEESAFSPDFPVGHQALYDDEERRAVPIENTKDIRSERQFQGADDPEEARGPNRTKSSDSLSTFPASDRKGSLTWRRRRRKKIQKLVLFGVLVCTILVLVIILAVVLSRRSSGNDTSSTEPNEEQQSGCEEGNKRCAHFVEVLLPVFPEKTKALLSTPNTCQSEALSWLTRSDYAVDSADRIRQRFALAVLHCELEGDTWSKRDIFSFDSHECTWYPEVNPCPDNKFRVIQMDDGGLQGTLPPELSMISTLKSISFKNNLIGGFLPTEYAAFSRLEKLVVSKNKFGGEVPSFIWEFNEMRHLDLSFNSFSGAIPDTLSSTEPNLRVLLLEHNSFEATLPSTFGSMNWLELRANDNKFEGPVPKFSAMDIEELMLHNNSLTGEFFIPTSEANGCANAAVQTKLRTVTLQGNDLSGDVNAMCTLFFDGNLETFQADLDELDCICCSSGLESDVLSFSTSTLPCMEDPVCIFVMESLGSSYTEQMQEFLEIKGTCQYSARELLRQDDNIKDFDVEKIHQRYGLAVTYCEMYGIEKWERSVPWLRNVNECDWPSHSCGASCNPIDAERALRSVDEYEQYRAFRFTGQSVSGTLAMELSMLSSLRELSIKGTQVGGSVPNSVWTFEKLIVLNLSDNDLSGTIPETLNKTEPDLQLLHLANNRFSGSIPSNIITPNLRELLLHDNKFTGAWNPVLTNDSPISIITVHNNDISGNMEQVCSLMHSKLDTFSVDKDSVQCGCCQSDASPMSAPSAMSEHISPTATTTQPPSTAISVTLPPSSSEGSVVITRPPESAPTSSTSSPTSAFGSVILPVNNPPTANPTLSSLNSIKPTLGTVALPPVPSPTLPPAPAPELKGTKTTAFDPYIAQDCFYGDNIQPHVISQCECFQSIDVIANDTLSLYEQIRQFISQEMYNGVFDEHPNSCDPRNQALYWLSSGNTRQAGDLIQRYIMALSFIQLNGTKWDLQNLWLSDESECIWFGLQCNSQFQLNTIAIDTNNIHGSIPTEISKMESLRTISLTRNNLSGSIPKEIIAMPKIENIFLYSNQLVGSIPTEIGIAKNLKVLRLQNNLFVGTVASEIGQATALEELDIGFNEFWRGFPTQIGLLTNMKRLVLEDNRFTGTLPTEFGLMTMLSYFVLSNNLMTGPIPTEFSRLNNLQEFRLADTGLGGTFPVQLAVLSNLNRLEMGGNTFRGTIMSEIGLMTGLSLLAMNDNDLTGTIPTEIGNLVNMTRLSFKGCLLTGQVPSELGKMTKLQELSLESNSITGVSPVEICSLRKLELALYVTDCYDGQAGVVCDIPDCCTFCRREEKGVSVTVNP